MDNQGRKKDFGSFENPGFPPRDLGCQRRGNAGEHNLLISRLFLKTETTGVLFGNASVIHYKNSNSDTTCFHSCLGWHLYHCNCLNYSVYKNTGMYLRQQYIIKINAFVNKAVWHPAFWSPTFSGACATSIAFAMSTVRHDSP